MKRTTQRTVLGAAALSLALLVSACGTSGGNDAGKDDKATTTTAAKETTTTVDPKDAAQERADSIDLDASDFGGGWTATAASTDTQASGLEQCGAAPDEDEVLAEFTTDDFSFGDLGADDGVQVSVKTKVFTDEAAATAALEPFSDEEVVACVDGLFKDQFAEVGTVDGQMGIEDYGDTKADEAVLVGGEFTVTTSDGTAVPVTVAVVVLRTGDLATQVQVTGVGPNLDKVDLGSVTDKVEQLQADA